VPDEIVEGPTLNKGPLFSQPSLLQIHRVGTKEGSECRDRVIEPTIQHDFNELAGIRP
jgi:hypothetical protein